MYPEDNDLNSQINNVKEMQRVFFSYETASNPNIKEVSEISSIIKKETGQSIDVKADGGFVVFGGDVDFIDHIVLDVGEAAARNILGSASDDKKSDLVLIGSEKYSVQPCFEMSEKLSAPIIREIERLYEFVTGIKGVGYYNENRFYIDTKSSLIRHIDMDVAEILVRRMIDGKSVSITKQGFKALPMREVSKKAYGGLLSSPAQPERPIRASRQGAGLLSY